MEQLYKTWGET